MAELAIHYVPMCFFLKYIYIVSKAERVSRLITYYKNLSICSFWCFSEGYKLNIFGFWTDQRKQINSNM